MSPASLQSPFTQTHSRGGSALEACERAVLAVEAWVGAVFTTLLSLAVGVPLFLALLVSPFSEELHGGPLALAAWMGVMWLRFDGPHLYRTWSAVRRGERPLAPSVAVRQPALQMLYRVPAMLWMLAHFGLGLAAAHFMQDSIPPGLQGNRPLGYVVFTMFLSFAYLFAANGFLLSAVKAITNSNHCVQLVWKWRLALDLALAGGIAALTVPSSAT